MMTPKQKHIANKFLTENMTCFFSQSGAFMNNQTGGLLARLYSSHSGLFFLKFSNLCTEKFSER